MRRDDTCFVVKLIDTGNKGYKEVLYSVYTNALKGGIEEMTFSELMELSEYLCRYVKREKEKGGAR